MRKNNAKDVHLPKNNNEAKHNVNYDIKSNCNGRNGKSNHNGKCDVKSNGKCKQDNKQSTRRCKDCRDKYEKAGKKRIKKTNFKKGSL